MQHWYSEVVSLSVAFADLHLLNIYTPFTFPLTGIGSEAKEKLDWVSLNPAKSVICQCSSLYSIEDIDL